MSASDEVAFANRMRKRRGQLPLLGPKPKHQRRYWAVPGDLVRYVYELAPVHRQNSVRDLFDHVFTYMARSGVLHPDEAHVNENNKDVILVWEPPGISCVAVFSDFGKGEWFVKGHLIPRGRDRVERLTQAVIEAIREV